MKIRTMMALLLMLVGSYANAASTLVGNGISWTTMIDGVGSNTGTITLKAEVPVSGASFGWGDVGYLAGFGIKDIADPNSDFTLTSVDTDMDNWTFSNSELSSGSGGACGGDAKPHRACAYANSLGDRISSGDGNLEIVLGVTVADGGVLTDGFHFKVLWRNLDGSQSGDLISDDLSQVPIPAAAWLFASALMGLTVVARRRDSKNSPPVA